MNTYYVPDEMGIKIGPNSGSRGFSWFSLLRLRKAGMWAWPFSKDMNFIMTILLLSRRISLVYFLVLYIG